MAAVDEKLSHQVNPQHVLFAEKASPHSWYLVMESLHEQASELYDKVCGRSLITVLGAEGREVTAFDPAHKSVFLLAGFALENAIKAFLVFENPSWITNGTLSSRLKSHDLVKLQRQSKLIPYKNRRNPILLAFSDGLDSWARYPCSLTASDTRDEALLPLELWLQYRTLQRSYHMRLRKILSQEWKGPYGIRGRYAFTGPTMPKVPMYEDVYQSWPASRRHLEDRLKRHRT